MGADGVPCHVVTAALDGNREIVFPGEGHRAADIFGVSRADNHVRTAVNHRVEDLPGFVVAEFSGTEQPATESRTQVLNDGWVKRR